MEYCNLCNKKNLIIVQCKCVHKLCLHCLDRHACTYDYKSIYDNMQKNEHMKYEPKKLDKI